MEFVNKKFRFYTIYRNNFTKIPLKIDKTEETEKIGTIVNPGYNNIFLIF